MKFVKWVIFITWFALSDIVLTTEQPSNNLTNKLNKEISEVFKSLRPTWNGSYVSKREELVKKQFNNGILYNITTKRLQWPPSKMELPSNEKDTFKIFGDLPFSFLEVYLRDSNQHIEAEKIIFNYVVKFTTENELSIDYPNFDLSEIKLISSGYQYKSNEEAQIKKAIKEYLKEALNEFAAIENKDSWKNIKNTYSKLLNKITPNNQEGYYFVGTVPSTNYVLNNVTIYGPWNPRSISFNVSNLEAYPELEMGNVRGSAVQNFPTKSEELSIKTDNIYISMNRNAAKVNVKVKSYSVVNAKVNTPLADDQSKLIIGEIESALAASIGSVWQSS